jgi:hypothetical protein
MKKIILIIFLFIFSIKNYAQTYRVNFQLAKLSCAQACLASSQIGKVVVYDINNNVILETNNFANLGNGIFIGDFETTVRPFKIIHQSSCKYIKGDSWGCQTKTVYVDYEITFNDFNECDYKVSVFPTNISDPLYHLKANLQTIPLNNSGCGNVNLSCAGNIERWEVKKYGSDVYEIIPNSNLNVLNKPYNDIYSNNSGINQMTYFRAKFTGTSIYTYHPFKFIPCPPKVNSTSNPNYTTCSDRNDGSVTFTFDRPLETGERFLFTRNPVGDNITTSHYSDNTNYIEKLSEYQYKWKNIPKGTYNFKYQTQFNNNTPSSDVIGPNFTITPKQELTFTTTPTQPLCNIDKGSITITTAQGGTPPYFYILDYETEIINNKSVPKKNQFISPIKLTLLSEGNHNIKVVDSNGCIEKQLTKI